VTPSRNPSRQLTPLETQIMNVLWDSGPATVQEVQSRLASPTRLAYTTVQTMLNVLWRKGRVKRTPDGKAYRYQAILRREKAITQSITDLADRLFGGSVDSLLMNLIEHRQIRREKLEELDRIIKERLQREREDEHGKS
jgi:predicted transcriptional regulator